MVSTSFWHCCLGLDNSPLVVVSYICIYHLVPISRGKLCAHHTWETIFGHIKCHRQFSEWGHASHIWQYDIGAQHISFKQQACQSRLRRSKGSLPDWHQCGETLYLETAKGLMESLEEFDEELSTPPITPEAPAKEPHITMSAAPASDPVPAPLCLQQTLHLQLLLLQLALAHLHHQWQLSTSLLRIFLPSWLLSSISQLHPSPLLLHKLP